MSGSTFVLQVEAGVADRAITAKGQVHGVGAALYSFWKLAVLKASDQRAVAVRSIVDIQEVVVGLYAEARRDYQRGVF